MSSTSTSSRIVIKPRQRNSNVFLEPTKSTRAMQEMMIKLKELEDSKQAKAAAANGGESAESAAKRRSPLLNRLIALKNLQYEHFKARAQFYSDLFQIEWNYQRKLQELCEKRSRIINGTYHVPGAHKAPLVSRYELRLGYELSYPTKRLPHFWLTVLLNTPVIKNMIERRDLKCLESLNDLRVQYHDDRSFTIEFHFDRNNYFSNTVLKKRYFQIATIDADDPFGYEGPEIYRAEGCAIYWKRGKNLTIARPRYCDTTATTAMSDSSSSSNELPVPLAIARRSRRYVDSFFHFFNPPQFPLEKVVVDMELERVLTIDFEVGNFLRKRVIPFASLVYIKLINSESKVEEARKIVDVTGNAPPNLIV